MNDSDIVAQNRRPVGFALGGGAARGWAHFGIIRALAERGVRPDVISGTSIGALVGAACAAGEVERLEEWARDLDWFKVVRFLDINFGNGGVIQGESLFKFFKKHWEDRDIAELTLPYGAVATDLENGEEVWLRSGSVLEAVRASMALPGVLTPFKVGDKWLVDGGLVDPVPVSLCRALGAETIIAVNLNEDIIGRRQRRRGPKRGRKRRYKPAYFDVLMDSIYIMQDHITRARLAGDPPTVVLSPDLAHIGLMEFDKADEAIAEGEACDERHWAAIEAALD